MMKRSMKLTLGALTVWPAVFSLVANILGFIILYRYFVHHSYQDTIVIFALILAVPSALTVLLAFGLLAYYINHIFKNNRLGKQTGVGWVVALWLGNLGAMPLYWYLYIWKEPAQEKDEEES